MAISSTSIIESWKQKQFATIYLLDGPEDFYIDQVVNFAEDELLPEEQRSFDLSIFYGKDSEWNAIVNACKRYPKMGEKNVVILKEAQYLKDLDKLENYIKNPTPSTIFIIAHKEKDIDKRKTIAKLLQSKSVHLNSPEISEQKVNTWIADFVKQKGLNISSKSIALLHEFIGSDLSRIANEIDKLIINLNGEKKIDEATIEKFIGISKEYNAFELQHAIAIKDAPKMIKIIQYFNSNSKAGNIHSVIPLIYGSFSRVYGSYSLSNTSGQDYKKMFYFNPNMIETANSIRKNYGYNGVQEAIMLMHEYNLRSLGVHSNSGNEELLLEMMAKIIAIKPS